MKRLGAAKYNDKRMGADLRGNLSSTQYTYWRGSNIYSHVHGELYGRLLHRIFLDCDVREELE